MGSLCYCLIQFYFFCYWNIWFWRSCFNIDWTNFFKRFNITNYFKIAKIFFCFNRVLGIIGSIFLFIYLIFFNGMKQKPTFKSFVSVLLKRKWFFFIHWHRLNLFIVFLIKASIFLILNFYLSFIICLSWTWIIF